MNLEMAISILLLFSINLISAAPSSERPDALPHLLQRYPVVVPNDGSIGTTRVLNLSNPDDINILSKFNMTSDALERLRNSFIQKHGQPSYTESPSRPGQQNSELNRISTAILTSRNNLTARTQEVQDNDDGSVSQPIQPITHEIAVYPICSHNNRSLWYDDNTAQVQFSSSVFENMDHNNYLHSAVLRLYMLNPDAPLHGPGGINLCDEPDDMIHIHISTLHKKGGNYKREKIKKRIIVTSSMIRGHTGWIDFDVRSAIKQWDKSRRNGGNGDSNNRYSIMPGKLAIDVEDPDQNPLKAGNFFEPIQCEASTKPEHAFPWILYNQRKTVRSIPNKEDLPLYPRLDMRIHSEQMFYGVQEMNHHSSSSVEHSRSHRHRHSRSHQRN